jgi:hypothetical protein
MILLSTKFLMRVHSFVFLILLFGMLAFAQQPQPTKEKESNYVDIGGFKGKIFELKNRDPNDLIRILTPLGSGFKGALMQPSREMKTLTVRDFPENIAAIEEALKRLDVPQSVSTEKKQESPSIEMILHVLLAHNETVDNRISSSAQESRIGKADASPKTSLPVGLDDVLNQLRKNINYKNYYLLTSIVQNSNVYSNVQSEGTVSVGSPLFSQTLDPAYRLLIRGFSHNFYTPESPIIKIDGFQFELNNEYFGRIAVRNDVSIREGEKLVVGTASLKDKALVLVLSVKVIK